MTHQPTDASAGRRRNLAGLSLVVGLAALASSGVVVAWWARSPRPAQTVASASHPAVLGLSRTAGGVELSVQSARLDPPTGSGRHLAVAVRISNATGQTMQIAPGLQLFVTDHTGRRYPATAAYLPAGATVGGPLDSGQSRLETIDFELDAQANPDHVSFELDSSSEPVVVGLP